MKLQRIFEKLSDLTSRRMIPQGIIDEGRIFALGVFMNEDHLHGRVTEVGDRARALYLHIIMSMHRNISLLSAL